MRASILALVSVVLLSFTAYAKPGAVLVPVDKGGKPVGPPVTVPDCRSCKVKQTGPNSYEIKIPKTLRDKVNK